MEIITPQGLTLYPFQVETVEKSIQFLSSTATNSVYNANPMGCGKSVTSIVTKQNLNLKRTLIICPSIMKLVWVEELARWAKGVTTSVISKGSDCVSNNEVIICSYALATAPNILAQLKLLAFDLLILDEAQYCKNARTKRTQTTLKELVPLAKYKIYLSGTPFTRNISDCFSTFSRILPTAFPKFKLFCDRYAYCKKSPFTYSGVEYYGLKNAEELSKIIRSNFFIRFKKEEVLPQLPPLQWQKITLPAEYSVKEHGDRAGKALYEDIQKTMQALIENKGVVIPPSLAAHRALQGLKKAPAIIDFVRDILEQDQPVVIFAHHKALIAEIHKGLSEYNPSIITGETNPANRMKAIDDFQSGKTDCFIGNIVAAGVGCSLPRSQTVVFAELSYSPSDNNQAAARCHRLTSRGQVTVYWFSVKDSIDEQVEKIVVQKSREFEKVFDSTTPAREPAVQELQNIAVNDALSIFGV